MRMEGKMSREREEVTKEKGRRKGYIKKGGRGVRNRERSEDGDKLVEEERRRIKE